MTQRRSAQTLGLSPASATREYAARRERLAGALRGEFTAWLEPLVSAAGLHLAARAVPGARVDVDEVVRRALASGVAVYPLSHFCGEAPAQAGLVLGYGAIATARIDEGLRRLLEAFRLTAGVSARRARTGWRRLGSGPRPASR